MSGAADPAGPARDAITQGIAALADLDIDAAKYRLIGIRNEGAGKHPEPFHWRLDFKIATVLATEPGGMVGKGGDLALLVDTAAGTVKRLRGGD